MSPPRHSGLSGHESLWSLGSEAPWPWSGQLCGSLFFGTSKLGLVGLHFPVQSPPPNPAQDLGPAGFPRAVLYTLSPSAGGAKTKTASF